MRRLACVAAAVAAAAFSTTAAAKTSHAGWPKIDGLLRIDHSNSGVTYTGTKDKHNKLLGGRGSDTLHAGAIGDVLWGDFNPSGQNETQVDTIDGGAGKDFIYASHGKNVITTGGGLDQVHAHFGRGTITCANPKATIFLSHKSKKRYKLKGCPRISFRTVGR